MCVFVSDLQPPPIYSGVCWKYGWPFFENAILSFRPLTQSCRGRAVKAMDSKYIGVSLRGFKYCRRGGNFGQQLTSTVASKVIRVSYSAKLAAFSLVSKNTCEVTSGEIYTNSLQKKKKHPTLFYLPCLSRNSVTQRDSLALHLNQRRISSPSP